MVGMTRFERATPSSQARCATKLRYIPLFSCETGTLFRWCATLSSRKTILNCFARQSATSRYYSIDKSIGKSNRHLLSYNKKKSRQEGGLKNFVKYDKILLYQLELLRFLE